MVSTAHALLLPDSCRKPRVIVDLSTITQDEWLSYRRKGLGGSDIAAVFGISPFKTVRDLYHEKTDPSFSVTISDWVRLEVGKRLESLVAEIFERKTGCKAIHIPLMMAHPDMRYAFALADVDFFIEMEDGRIGILETKTSNIFAKEYWTDGVPIYYEYQVRHYMAVCDVDFSYVACLFGNSEKDFLYHEVKRDRALELEMLEEERLFWHCYVLGGMEPPYLEETPLVAESVARIKGLGDPALPPLMLHPAMGKRLQDFSRLQKAKKRFDSKSREAQKEMDLIKNELEILLGPSCSAACEIGGWRYNIKFEPEEKESFPKERQRALSVQEPDIYRKYAVMTTKRPMIIERERSA